MEYALFTKEEVEQTKFTEKAGMINAYVCPSCKTITTYLYVDENVTKSR